jgi:multiple sugar transport system permease protein
MAVTALKQDRDLYRMDVVPFWFHLPPTLEHVTRLFTHTHFASQLFNTLQLAVCVVAVTMLAAVPAGYALARLRLRWSENLGIAIFLTYLVPGIILFVPLARVVGALGLFDSWWALVVVYPTFTIPFCTWKMMGYFKTVPAEIEEAAWVDGCTRPRGIWHVVLPVSRPGLVITAIFSFSLAMQEGLYAVVYVSTRSAQVVTVGLATTMIRGDIFYWGSLMAGALIIGIPIALLYAFVLDEFIQGLTGAVGR